MNEIKEKIKRFVTLRGEAAEALNSITPLLKPYMDFIKSDHDWVDYVEYDDKTNLVLIQYQDWDEYDPEYRNKIDRIGLEYFDDPEAYVSKLKALHEISEKEKARLDKERKEEESRKARLAEFERLKKELFPDENSDCRPDLY
jgi:hypothetical protein